MNDLQIRIHHAAVLSASDVETIFQEALEDVKNHPLEIDQSGQPLISIAALQGRVGYWSEQNIQYAQLYVDGIDD